jgi:uncharacterized protein
MQLLRTRPAGVAAPLSAVLVLLLAVALLDRLVPAPVQTGLHLLVACALVVLARAAGLTFADLGMTGGSLRRTVAYSVACVVLVCTAYVLVLALPWTRTALLDTRYQYDVGTALVVALTTVPLRTVLLEEVAFRGVLWALVRRAHGPVWATTVSSVLFGVWHVLPALAFAGTNQAVGARGVHPGAVVAATLLVTTAAGVLLCELRRRSGSLVPAVALHWVANGAGILAAAAAWSLA